MIIWLIQTGEIIPFSKEDRVMRTGYLAKELANRGHDVIWWTSAFEHQKRRWINNNKDFNEISSNLIIYFLKGCGYSKNLSLRRYIDHLLVARQFAKRIKSLKKPDIIIACLPDHNLAYEAIRYAKNNNISSIVDLRDPWPDFFLEFVNNAFLKLLLRKLLFIDFYKSRFCLKNSTSLVSMMNSLLEWGKQKGNRKIEKFDKVFYLGAKRLSDNNSEYSANFQEILEKTKDTFNVLFIGTINNYYNPNTIVFAAKECIKNDLYHDKINFIIAGSGDLLNEVKSNAQGLGNVFFTDWVNEEQINSLLRHCHVGIIPSQLDSAVLPNKAFTFFSGSMPVVSSAKGELADLIESEVLGLNFEKGNYIQLLENVFYLYNNNDLLVKMKKNIEILFDKNFCVDKIYIEYANLIEKIIENNKYE
jgi:glycosyltransferase involved in cell wall biosynthesis